MYLHPLTALPDRDLGQTFVSFAVMGFTAVCFLGNWNPGIASGKEVKWLGGISSFIISVHCFGEMQSDGVMFCPDYEQRTLQGIVRLVFEAAMDL